MKRAARRWLFTVALALNFTFAAMALVTYRALLTPEPPPPPPPPPPEFKVIPDAQLRKETFFDYLRPIVRAENEALLALRGDLLELRERHEKKGVLPAADEDRVRALARTYRVPRATRGSLEIIDDLLHKVDIIPESLALAQAANESAWGTSRFAVNGRNFFGEWCFDPGCGIVPRRRPEGATYEVESFDSVRESVRSYLHNLNSHPAYAPMRRLRAESRRRGEPLSGVRLAEGLTAYSGRGAAYVREIQAMIIANELEA